MEWDRHLEICGQYAARIAELEAKNVELQARIPGYESEADRLTVEKLRAMKENDILRQQLAASQAREKVLREALEKVQTVTHHYEAYQAVVTKALALPQDTTVLDELLAKERERCANICDKYAKQFGPNEMSGHFDHDCGHVGRFAAQDIRSLKDLA